MSDSLGDQGEPRHRYRRMPSGRGTGGAGGHRLEAGGGGHVDDLAAAYALGALEAAERELVERHVRVCPECARLVAEDARTVGFLPLASPPFQPAPDVKVALFARIAHAQRAAAAADLPTRRARALPPTLTIPTSRPAAVPVDAAPAAEAPARGAAPWARSGGGTRLGWATAFLSVPLLVALVATGVWGLQLRAQVTESGAEVDALRAQLAIFGAGALQYPLNPGAAAPQAEGTIILGQDLQRGMVVVDLNTPGPERTYQMLVMKDGKLVPEAEVTVDEQGFGQAPFELEQPFDQYQSVQVQAKPLEPGAAGATATESVLRGDIDGSIGEPGSGANGVLP